MPTPEEIRARLLANIEAMKSAAAVIDPAAKAAKAKEKDDEEGEKEGAVKDALSKGQGLAVKAHKAVKAMHEHAEGNEHVEKGHKEACAKAMKAMGSCAKAWGGPAAEEAESVDAKQEGGEKSLAYGEAMKAIGAMQQQIKMLEAGTYSPRGAGAGAVMQVAKGGQIAEGAQPAAKGFMPSNAELAKMSADERKELALKSLRITRSIPIPADQFKHTGTEVLHAARQMAEQAAMETETAENAV